MKACMNMQIQLMARLDNRPKQISCDFFVSDLTKEKVIELLLDGYELCVRMDDDYEHQVVIEKDVEETPEQIQDRVFEARQEHFQLKGRLEAEQLILQNLETELANLETEIKGFWNDPIRKANLENA